MEKPQSGKQLGILDYGMGNLKSVKRAFEASGANVEIIATPSGMHGKDALVFPGQGAIGDCMKLLRSTGWNQFILDWISADRPFFGICLGLQALFDYCEEADTEGLGVIKGAVRRFKFDGDCSVKIPHMGWNVVTFSSQEGDPMINGLNSGSDQFYFVHSYYAIPEENTFTWGTTEYGGRTFCSAVRRGNLIATQFHPEKSQKCGLQLYENFVRSL